MAEARGPALKSPARTGGRAEAGSALARMNSSTAITWASRTAVESRGEVHAVGVDPGGPYVEKDFRPGVLAFQARLRLALPVPAVATGTSPQNCPDGYVIRTGLCLLKNT
jgi:hypothetical protein